MKYGSILTGLITQQSLRNDQYPKTITKAYNVLSNHKFDIVRVASKNPNRNGSKQAKWELEPEKINLSFAQMEGKCFCCYTWTQITSMPFQGQTKGRMGNE
jgi:hypothetical protein